jgi:nucleoside-diphosphate-sugar epimerase
LGDLKIFGADLTDEGSFDAPIAGCDLVFHLATPVHFASEDPEVQNCRTHHIPNFGNNVTAAYELLTTMLLLFI